MRQIFSGLLVLGVVSVAGAEGRTTLEATTSVQEDQDACLDHTVKELGMSAKRRDKERKWNIGPQFLHPSLLPDGTVLVELARGDKKGAIALQLDWAGGLKDKAVQSEIEQRAVAIVGKMAQMCGLTKPAVRCTTTVGNGAAAACTHLP